MPICCVRTLFSLKGAVLFLITILTSLVLLLITSLLFGDRGKEDSSLDLHGPLSKHQGLQGLQDLRRLVPPEGSLRGLKVQHERLGSKLLSLASGAGDERFPGRMGGGRKLRVKTDGRLPGKTGRKLPGNVKGEFPGGRRRSSPDLSLGHMQHLEKAKAGQTRKTSSPMECSDVLCTNHLSRLDLRDLFRCQQSASRRYQKFLKHRLTDNSSKILREMPTSPGGILVTGNCRFMCGEGV